MNLATARSLDRIGLLLATVGLVAEQYNIPSEEFWKSILSDYDYTMVLLIAVAGTFGAVSPFETLSQKFRVEQATALRQQILATFGQLLDMGSKISPPLGISDMGLHIWRKRRTLRHPLRGELTRVATYRLGSAPVPRPFRPTLGVGVVGLCWKRDEEVSMDTQHLSRKLDTEEKFDDYRKKHGEDAVMGLSWDEFRRFSHRGAVFASPIRNGRADFAGCVSLDAGHGYSALNHHQLWHELNSLCITIYASRSESMTSSTSEPGVPSTASVETAVRETRRCYGRIAEEYADATTGYHRYPGLRESALEFEGMLPPGPVLDLGCGGGRDTRLFSHLGRRVIAGDISAPMLTAARARSGPAPEVGYVELDMRSLPVRTGALAGAWACGSLLHLPSAAFPRVLSELHRVLAPGGAINLSMRSGREELWRDYGDSGHRRWFSFVDEDMFRSALSAADFERVTTARVGRTGWFVALGRKST